LLPSCQKGPGYLVTDAAEIKDMTPTCVIWYRSGGRVNKSWFQEDEVNKIKELLIGADKTLVYPGGEYKLSLIFYDGHPENLKLWEVSFTLVGKKSFLSSVGSSRELGELLSEYKPVIKSFADPNRIKLFEGILEETKQEAEKRERELDKEGKLGTKAKDQP